MKNKALVILVVIIFLLSLIPIIHTYFQTNILWQGVVPSFVDDDLYYYARMQNVIHGYYLIGNPYFFEHRQEISPAFFAPDWLSIIPIKLGIPLAFGVALNFIMWSIIFSILSYIFFRQQNLLKSISVIGTILVYLTTYYLLLRPVSMQIVAPFFLLFYITYAVWLKSEKPSKRQYIFLIFGIAFSFYIYTYLWQIVLAVLSLTFLFLIYQKDWLKFRNFLVVCVIGIILGFSAVLYTLKQVSSPFYWDTMYRIGLVNTYLPTVLSFYDGAMILVILSLGYFSYLWVENLKNNNEYRDSFLLSIFIGGGLLVALFSNVITGKELEIANHIERFIVIWVPITFITFAYFLIKNRSGFYSLGIYKKMLLSLFFVLSSIIFIHFLVQGFSIKTILNTDTLSVQAYAKPLKWLNENVPKESVIWSNGNIGYYLPTMTTDFSLFNGFGVLHLLSSKELEERYLVSNYFNNLTLQDIKRDFRQYAGVGNSIHQYKTFNRKVRICQIAKLSYFGVDCGTTTDPISFKGEKYFIDLYNEYNNDIKPNISNKLKKFNVKYIVKDKRGGSNFSPEKISGTKLVWSNDRFEIYSFTE